MMHSKKVNTNNTTTVENYNHLAPPYSQQLFPLPSPMPLFNPYYYSNYSNWISGEVSKTSSAILPVFEQNLSKKKLPNMKEFLEELDKEFGEEKFTCYLPIFEEQEIRVNQLTKLTDLEYTSMGITVIGRRQTLRDEAKKYE